MIELLIVSHRLTAKQSDDPKAIGKALDEMALETLRAHGRTNNVSPTRGTCPPTSLPGSSVR
jgi:hypothetical protein